MYELNKLDGHSDSLSHKAAVITLYVYGILKLDNNKPNQMFIFQQFHQFVSLLMKQPQHLAVMINPSVYGMFNQENLLNQQISLTIISEQNLIPHQQKIICQLLYRYPQYIIITCQKCSCTER